MAASDGLMRVALDGTACRSLNGVLAVERFEDAAGARRRQRMATRARRPRWWRSKWRTCGQGTGMNRHRNDGIDPVARSRSRRRALQAIYAWQLSATSEGALIAEFAHEQAHEIADLEYFEDLVRRRERHRERNSTRRWQASSTAGRRGRPDRARRAAHRRLRTAAPPDVPYRVVINEAIETTKRFGAEHGHTYVNGVLDKAPRLARGEEVAEGCGAPAR
jgi:N utilization substance protein B